MVRVNVNGRPSIEAQMMYRRAFEMEGRGRFDAALNLLKKAIIIAPRFAKAFDEMGNCLDSLGRYPEALAAYNRILEIDPSHPGALFKRDRIQKKIGSSQSAAKHGGEEVEGRPVRTGRDPGHSLMYDLAMIARHGRRSRSRPGRQICTKPRILVKADGRPCREDPAPISSPLFVPDRETRCMVPGTGTAPG